MTAVIGKETSRVGAPLVVVTPTVADQAARVARGPLPAGTATGLGILLSLTALAVWSTLFLIALGGLREQHDQNLLFARFRSQLAQATAPTGPTAFGKPVALMSIPGAGLRDAVVVEGTSSAELQKGPGHRRDSVLPGQAGTAVVYGKSVTYGRPFGRIRGLGAGDGVTVTTGQGVFRYVVEGVRRPGDRLPAAVTAGQSRLVLVTAEGAGWRNRLAPTSIVYVDALMATGAVPVTTAIPSAVVADEKPFEPRTGALLPLVLWLQLLLAVCVGAVWLRSRWGRWQSWTVTVPVVLGVSFFATATASQLLPNLL